MKVYGNARKHKRGIHSIRTLKVRYSPSMSPERLFDAGDAHFQSGSYGGLLHAAFVA
jgi:hypothetical protein